MGRSLKQGDIYYANLNPRKGHEQSGYRPVLIVQNNILNKNLNTVIVAPITKNLSSKGYLTTYFLEKKVSGLPLDSVILLFQLRAIDMLRCTKKAGNIPPQILQHIKKQLLLAF